MTPQFVRDFCSRRLGERVALIRVIGGFDGTIEAAEPVGKRIRYAVRLRDGTRRQLFADEPGVAHLGKPKETICG